MEIYIFIYLFLRFTCSACRFVACKTSPFLESDVVKKALVFHVHGLCGCLSVLSTMSALSIISGTDRRAGKQADFAVATETGDRITDCRSPSPPCNTTAS